MAGGGGGGDTDPSPDHQWVAITQGERTLYEILFYSQGPVGGYILGEGVRELLLKSGLSLTTLSQIWNLADVSNDNVLNVHEFSLVMHLVRGRMAGLVVPQTLPRILTPPKTPPLAPPPMSQQEKDAYLRVFQALDVKRTGFIDGDVATALLRSSGLSDDVITSIWDVADFGRDGRLNPEELAIAGHLVRHVKTGGALDGPVNIFQYAPQHVSPISLLARKRRVAEYQEHKQRLMSLKETRKQQSTRETRRLELVKTKIKCLEELAILLRKLGKPEVAEDAALDRLLNEDKEDVKKQEEIVFRLKKEHEKVRQETVKIILGEHVFNEDNRVIKADTDELNKRLLTSHSHATKDPDPFHQLYEQRKEKRQGSTIKDLDKIDIYIPFEFSPFDLQVTPDTLPSGTRILNEFSNESCGADVLSVIADVKGFGEEFMQDWGGSPSASSSSLSQSSSNTALSSSSSSTTAMSSSTVLSTGSERKDFDDDEIFIEVEENRDRWPPLDGSDDCLLGFTDDQVVSLKAKLSDLRNELKQLNAGHRKLIFRNPEDYTARQRAKEAEEVSDRGRFNRRSATERLRNSSSGSSISRTSREGNGSGGVRYRATSDRSPSETAQAVRDYRLKRRSQNLDSASASSSPDSTRRFGGSGVSNQDSSLPKKPLSSSIGSPSVSDEASLSRQSSLSSTDRPVTNTTVTVTPVSQLQSPTPVSHLQSPIPVPISDRIEEEIYEPVVSSSQSVVDTTPSDSALATTTSPVHDSSVLKLKSNRRKDELSLALGSTALGRTITVEPATSPVSATNEIKHSDKINETVNNIDTHSSHKDKNVQEKNKIKPNLSNGDAAPTPKQPTQSAVLETTHKASSKKSRAPLPPPSPQGSNVNPLNTTRKSSSVEQTSTDNTTLPPPIINNNSNSTKSTSSNKPQSSQPNVTVENNAKDITKNSDAKVYNSVPRRPPRIKKNSTSEKRNSGSFNSDSSSFSSSCTDSFDKSGPISPTRKTDTKQFQAPKPTQETMATTNIKTRQAPPAPKLQPPSKKRPAPSPSAQQINEATISVEHAPPPTSPHSVSSPSTSTLTSSSDSLGGKKNLPPLTINANSDPKIGHSNGSNKDDDDDTSVNRDDNDSPPPPPLPVSPPPLPSARPPSLMQEDLDIEEEMITVEYTASVSSPPPSNNLPVMPLSPPTMRATTTTSNTTTRRYDLANSSSEDTASAEPTSLSSSDIGLGNDLHLDLNGIDTGDGHVREVDSSGDDSDLTDTDEEDQNGKYGIFSPGDSGIMTTSSIATTPDESSDGNIELVNYTPYNNDNVITNNNYITTNYNFANNRNNNNDHSVNNTAASASASVTSSNLSVTNTASSLTTTTNNTSSSSLISSATASSVPNGQPVFEMDVTPSVSQRISNSPNPSSSYLKSSPSSQSSSLSKTISPQIVQEDTIVASLKPLPQMSAAAATPASTSSSSLPPSRSTVDSSKHESNNIFNGHNSSSNNNTNGTVFEHQNDADEFRSSLPKWSDKDDDKVMSPRNMDIMAKARHFADMVQPKQVVVLKSEISKHTDEARGSSKDPSAKEVETLRHQKTSMEEVAKQRQDIISEATTKKKALLEDNDEVKTKSSNPSDYGYTYLTPRDQPPPEVGWKDKEAEVSKGVVSLYSQNVVKEGDTTEAVDRESIANLNTTKQQWETIFTSNLQSPEDDSNLLSKKKTTTPRWEVKLPNSCNKGVNGSVKIDAGSVNSGCSDSGGIDAVDSGKASTDANTMDVIRYNNNNNNTSNGKYEGESAIEYEIRIAREREEMLVREKEERARLLAQSPIQAQPPQTQISSSPAPPQAPAPAPHVVTHNQKSSVFSPMEAVNGESESYQPAYNELTEADRGPDVWSMDGGIRTQDKYEVKEPDPNESIIEREIRLQQEKEAELERQRLMLSSQRLPASSSSSSCHSPTPSTPSSQPQQQHQQQQHHNYHETDEVDSVQHKPEALRSPPPSARIVSSTPRQNEGQESLIARELRELKEREEEMRRLRELVHGTDSQKSENENENHTENEQSPVNHQPPPQQHSFNPTSLNISSQTANNNVHKKSQSFLSPSQTTPIAQGTWQREVSPFVSQQRRVSQDSGSSHSHSVSKASSDNLATTPSRSVGVKPISDGQEGSDDDEKFDFFKKQETPIEREMRLAKERENELRRMKGMPELSNKDDYFGSYGANADKSSENNGGVSSNKPISNKAPTQQSLKKVSNTRLHQEMTAQKEREKNEGKAISDSAEFKPFRYMEVTGSQTVDGSEKRNFVTKRTSTTSSPQIVEAPKTPTNNVSQSPSVAPNTPSSAPGSGAGSKKGLGGGSKNFSYKEFRQTAESKIERELREMREREEELRNQRRSSTVQTPR